MTNSGADANVTADRTPGTTAVGVVWLAVVLDLAAIMAFVIIGRSSHTEGESVAGIVSTAWPFLVGLAVGWLVMRAWQNPTRLVPTTLGIWAATVAVGMILRVIAGQGTAVSFIIVACVFLGMAFFGWRLAARVVTRRSTGGNLASRV